MLFVSLQPSCCLSVTVYLTAQPNKSHNSFQNKTKCFQRFFSSVHNMCQLCSYFQQCSQYNLFKIFNKEKHLTSYPFQRHNKKAEPFIRNSCAKVVLMLLQTMK